MTSNLLTVMFLACTLAIGVQARCPNWCNQRGVCSSPAEGGNCICDMGFAGEDCSQRLCPAGFDPFGLDTNNNRRTIRLETGNMGGKMYGKIEFGFAGSSVKLEANANSLSGDQCTAVLAKLQSVSSVSCVRETTNEESGVGSYLITLNKFPQMPFMNNLIHHDGNPSRSLFSCDSSLVDAEEAIGPYCRISDVALPDKVPVYGECSVHGTCDRVYGKCACERGFKGIDCNDMRDDQDIIAHNHDGPFFTASLLKLNVQRDTSPAFNLLSAQINGVNVTTITGDGKLLHSGDANVHGSIAVGGKQWKDYDSNIMSVSGSVKRKYHLQAFDEDGSEVLSIARNGDISSSGRLSAGRGSFVVEDGVATAQELKIASLDVAGSANVEESLTIGSGFALTPGGMTVDVAKHTGTLFELRSRQEGFNGSLLELHAVGEKSSMIKTVANGLTTFELSSSGHVKMQGLRLSSGGVQVDSGGIQVDAGGITVKGGLTIESGSLTVTDQQFNVGGLHAQSSEDNQGEALLSGHVTSPLFMGSVLDLSAVPSEEGKTGKFSFLSCRKGEAESVFSVNEDGNLHSAGSAVFSGASGVVVKGTSSLQGDVSLRLSEVIPTLAEDGVSRAEIPLDATYVVIRPLPETSLDSVAASVEVTFAAVVDGVSHPAGRVVIITNQGAKTTTGAVAVPSESTVMLVWSGDKWVDVEALKAPMHVLKNVRVFEADADVHIGNHTFGANRLSASALLKGRVVFGGSNGLLIDSEKFTFVKGVLTAPSLKVDKLVGDIDAKGYIISNVVLSNARVEQADIRASSLSVAGQSGLAYFTAKGALQGSTGLSLNEAGRLLITDLHSDIDLHGHTMNDLSVSNADKVQANSVEIKSSLTLPSHEFPQGGVLVAGANGKVVSALSAVDADGSSVVVSIKNLNAGTLAGPLDANHQEVTNANLKGGSITDIAKISVSELVVSNLRAAGGEGSRIVFTNADGKLQAQSHPDSVISIPNLTVDKLKFRLESVDLGGVVLKNAKLDESVSLSKQTAFETGSLQVSDLGLTKGGRFVTADSAGRLALFSEHLQLHGNVLDISTGAVHSNAIKTDRLTITEHKSVLLATDAEGVVGPAKKVEVDTLVVDRSTTLSGTVTLKDFARGASLLAVDGSGKVVPVESAEGKNTPVTLNTLSVDQQLTAGSIKAVRADLGTVYVSESAHSGDVGAEAESKSNILIREQDGKVSSFPKGHLDVSSGTLHINHIQPVTAKDTLTLSSSLIRHSNLTDSAVHNAPYVTTDALTVKSAADFFSDVTIEGTLNVRGTVVGSGPYVDSSDRRFKTDISPLKNALNVVMNLSAVTYQFRTEEFADRHFPTTPQIGFIADEVAVHAPDLVSEDKDGYQAVSYSHAVVYATEAIKELKLQSDAEIAALKNEVAELKALVLQLLKDKQSST